MTRLLGSVSRGLMRVHEFVSRVFMQLGVIFMTLMTLAVLVQVVMRYVFSSPVSWLEEFCIYSMFIMTFLLGPYILLNKLHISMTLLYDKIQNTVLKSLADIVLNSIVLYGILAIIPSIVEVISNNMSVTTVQMPLTKGQIYWIVIVSFLLMFSITVGHILQSLVDLVSGRSDIPVREETA